MFCLHANFLFYELRFESRSGLEEKVFRRVKKFLVTEEWFKNGSKHYFINIKFGAKILV